jgi:hypothetical protein
VIYTPAGSSQEDDQRFADTVLEKAESFRRDFSDRWFGEQLPTGVGRSVIYIEFSASEDRGLTWAKDHPERVFHNVYLTTSPEKATGSTLHHELVHSILATRYPYPTRLPSWIEEGIASSYDDDVRQATREQLLRFWASTGRAPSIANLLAIADMKAFDESSYAAATSLVSFLLAQGGEEKLLRFAEDGQRDDWGAALDAHYNIQSQQQLQSQWQAWLAAKFR